MSVLVLNVSLRHLHERQSWASMLFLAGFWLLAHGSQWFERRMAQGQMETLQKHSARILGGEWSVSRD
jgi:hypothetical protein